MSIRLFYDETNWRLRGSQKIKRVVIKVIESEGYTPGDLNFIFTPDKRMITINREFLKHNYYTDVITFSELTKSEVSGEVYVGFETVKRNAKNYKVSYKDELCRVIVHGTLHLCGYNDATDIDRRVMREKEDYWLNYFQKQEDEF